MKRREFIGLIGGAMASPFAARAQTGTVRKVALLLPYAEGDPQAQARVAAIKKALGDAGWTEGRNVAFHFRWATNDPERLRAHANELVKLSPDVILTPSSAATAEVQKLTGVVPVVFVNVLDPVSSGFVKSIARPGGNITGFTTVEPSIGGKWLELLTAVSPGVKRAALLFSETGVLMAPGTPLAQAFEIAAPAFPALEVVRTPFHNLADLQGTIETAARIPNTGLIVCPEPFTSINYERITALAGRNRLPAVYPYRFFATSGGFISYGIDLVGQYRQAGGYVDRILKGAAPADLPVQLPTTFELVVNRKAATALGLTLSPALLARADEVIE
jgi:putative tryptophan/tyrosine transport system substrate-binding protein